MVFAGSVALNVALFTWFVFRRADASPAVLGKAPAGSVAPATGSEPGTPRRDFSEAPGNTAQAGATAGLHWAALDSPDLPTLIARLRAAGFSTYTLREIVSVRVDALFAARMREIVGTPADQPYWQGERIGAGMAPRNYEAMSQLFRERARVLRELLADPSFGDAPLGAVELERRRQLGSLPGDKADAVQRIADDYSEMAAKVRSGTGGILLPEDREQLALLEREKRADLATVLGPPELAEYEMRTSPVTSRLRPALTLMDATEEEFRAIYAVQQPYGEMLYPAGSGVMVQGAQRQELERQLAEQLKAVLGEERYADFERSNDREFQQLNQIAQRENVSRDAAVQAYNLRNVATRESNRIFDDQTMTIEQKRTALQTLAQNTRIQLRNTLGPVAGDAYTRAAGWLNSMGSGQAVTIGPGGFIRMRGLPTGGKTGP